MKKYFLPRAPRSLVVPLKRAPRSDGKHSLLFQRLFWGALAGCLMAFCFGDSPVLENLELSMLDWRYQTAARLASSAPGQNRASSDIAIVAFDDASQFDLGCPRFNESSAQKTLSEILETVESGDPAVVAVDLDLRGAVNPDLVQVFRHYRNVVLSVFGSLEGSSDLPDAAFLKHAIGYGYDELPRESNGQVLRLPINTPGQQGAESSQLMPVPSITEAVVNAYRQIKGFVPADKVLQSLKPDQPAYINFQHTDYPVYSMSAVHAPGFKPSVFRNRIVLVAPTLTSRRQDPSHVITPLRGRTPEVFVHADAIRTILHNQTIFSYPRALAHHILLLLGAAIGAIGSVLTVGRRMFFCIFTGVALVLVAQVAFQEWHTALPVVSPLAVLISSYLLATLIHLDTDLRQRNRELAAAREHMQVRAEEERKRIAEDLHDETLPALSSVARMIDELYKVDDARQSSVPEKMRVKIDATIAEMRRVINDLHPSVLETMGFVPALENLAVILTRDTGIEYNFLERSQPADYQISDFAKLQLYRIVQEALNNVGKHSQATQVELKLQVHGGNLEISVVDNGRGINPKLIRRDSHGLLNIRHRAQLIGAVVDWRRPAAFSQGTEMRVCVPLLAEEKSNGVTISVNTPQKGTERA